jgi:hypothetical protein
MLFYRAALPRGPARQGHPRFAAPRGIRQMKKAENTPIEDRPSGSAALDQLTVFQQLLTDLPVGGKLEDANSRN